MRKTRQNLSTGLFSSKNILKKFSFNNDGEHTRKTEDGVPLIYLLSCNHKADGRLHALHASKSRAYVVVKLKDRHLGVSYL